MQVFLTLNLLCFAALIAFPARCFVGATDDVAAVNLGNEFAHSDVQDNKQPLSKNVLDGWRSEYDRLMRRERKPMTANAEDETRTQLEKVATPADVESHRPGGEEDDKNNAKVAASKIARSEITMPPSASFIAAGDKHRSMTLIHGTCPESMVTHSRDLHGQAIGALPTQAELLEYLMEPAEEPEEELVGKTFCCCSVRGSHNIRSSKTNNLQSCQLSTYEECEIMNTGCFENPKVAFEKFMVVDKGSSTPLGRETDFCRDPERLTHQGSLGSLPVPGRGEERSKSQGIRLQESGSRRRETLHR